MSIQPGQTILNGKYRIEHLIGEGGMARVWLAEEPRFGNRRVAIKEPRTDLLPELVQEVRLRYQREVQVCAALEKARTPQIVRAITTELLGDTLLLVMEYLPGGDLGALLKDHPGGLSVERVVAIALDLLAALEAVHGHELEIVHRDVKPSNVLFDEEGKAHLADFGLAQLAGMSGRSQLAGGQHPGTPMYMAPEQESSPRSLTPAADLYAVGCVLFEMLTGKRYKRVRPGTLPGALRAETPRWLEEVVSKTLAEDPWDRYAGAAEMATAMREAEERARAQAAEESTRVQSAEEARRREENASARPSGPALIIRHTGQVLHLGQEPVTIGRKEGNTIVLGDPQASLHHATIFWQAGGFVLQDMGSANGTFVNEIRIAAPQPLRDGHVIRMGNTIFDVHLPPIWQQIGIEMVTIPAGEFLYGDQKERIYLPEYAVAKTPVTNAQYKTFVEDAGHQPPRHWERGKIPEGKEDHPVIYVSWHDSVAFCGWARCRLPTEQEWEKGARGTDGRKYPWGDRQEEGPCNTYEAVIGDTTPVDRYPEGASPYGLLDMAGNVWEWCADWYGPSPNTKVLRGGSWSSYLSNARSAYRSRDIPVNRDNMSGFRCVV